MLKVALITIYRYIYREKITSSRGAFRGEYVMQIWSGQVRFQFVNGGEAGGRHTTKHHLERT